MHSRWKRPNTKENGIRRSGYPLGADCGYEDVIVCKRVGIKSQKKEDKQESNTENRRLQADIVTKLTDVNILRKSKDLVLKKKKKK